MLYLKNYFILFCYIYFIKEYICYYILKKNMQTYICYSFITNNKTLIDIKNKIGLLFRTLLCIT